MITLSRGLLLVALCIYGCRVPSSFADAAQESVPMTLSGYPGRGVTFTAGNGLFALTLRGRLQVRDTVSIVPLAATTSIANELNVRALRLVFEGHVFSDDFRYQIQLALAASEFETGSSSPLLDAWAEYRGLRDLHVRVGQFYVPLDRARTVRESSLQLVDRSPVLNEFALDRDVGIQLSSTDLFGARHVLSYYLGVFGGEGRNRVGQGPVGFLYVARVALTPFGDFDHDVEGDLLRLHRPRLLIGGGVGYNQNSQRQRSTTGPTYTLGGFDYLHAAADLVFKYAGVSVLAEMLYRNALGTTYRDMLTPGMALREWSRSGLGYLAQMGVMVHDKVEVVARWGHLLAFSPTDPALEKLIAMQGHEAGGALNVYLSGHQYKAQVDYFYLFGDMPSQGQHAVRVQLQASF